MNGKRVLILGVARQGLAAARWLARHGAKVSVNNRREADEMAEARSALADTPVTWVLGSHPVEILDTTDILCVSGGVPLDNPLVVTATQRGIPLTNDTQIFMEVAPCRTIGITGSAGKTTTTTLVGQMAINAVAQNMGATESKVFIGGNTGDPLLNHADEMTPKDLAILEISSFQLEQMTISPNVAAILNITPNHLDRHGTMEAYTAAKRRILEFQHADDTAVLNREDAGSWNLHTQVLGRLVSFGFSTFSGNSQAQNGTFLADGTLYLRLRSVEIPLLRRDQIRLRGEHNVSNVLAAFAIGYAAMFLWMPCFPLPKSFTAWPTGWNSSASGTVFNGTTISLPLHPNGRWQPSIHSRNRLSCSWVDAIRTCPGKNWPPWYASVWST